MFQGQFPAITPITLFLGLKSSSLAIWQDSKNVVSMQLLVICQEGPPKLRLPGVYSGRHEGFHEPHLKTQKLLSLFHKCPFLFE